MLALLMAVAVISANDTTHFDLLCVGTGEVNGVDQGDFSKVFHVDLFQKLWCVNECKKVGKIVSLNKDEIVFLRTNINTVYWNHYVSRVSGLYLNDRRIGSGNAPLSTFRYEGKCQRKPGTLMPARLF
jgi:hypothetical protein